MVDKRFQVFVSSTYRDLEIERQELIQALLELDCIPSGMELFPAANEDQWSLIKKIIDDCDYYVVVIAGKYGSIGSGGLSYTEMEYRYALSKSKPVIAFLHKDINKLSAERSELDAEKRKKLLSFMDLAKKKMVRFWETPAELGSVVSRSLVQLIKSSPAVGWVRANNVPDESAAQEILRLRKEIDRLQVESDTRRSTRASGSEMLSQGDDPAHMEAVITYYDGNGYTRSTARWATAISWNKLLAATAPAMIDEAKRDDLESRVSALLLDEERDKLNSHEFFKGKRIHTIAVNEQAIDTFIVQMIALGAIEKSTKNRSVKDVGTYWRLTPYGEKLMYELRAIKRPDLFSDKEADTNSNVVREEEE